MTAITTVTPPEMDSKSLLEMAEQSYRFGRFSDAYRDCKLALEKDEFANWKDKRKHDAIKSLIRYGHYASGYASCHSATSAAAPSGHLLSTCRRSEVLTWLQARKAMTDYPLYICEWSALYQYWRP